ALSSCSGWGAKGKEVRTQEPLAARPRAGKKRTGIWAKGLPGTARGGAGRSGVAGAPSSAFECGCFCYRRRGATRAEPRLKPLNVAVKERGELRFREGADLGRLD